MQPPQFGVSFDDLPTDPKKRHEILVDLFGQYIILVQSEVLDRIRQIVVVEEQRNKLGVLFRDVFEQVAKLQPEEQEIAFKLAQSSVSQFAARFLTMISGQGFDDYLGPNHIFRYRLDMEICDAESGEVIFEETINRGGEKFFPEYWGRWQHRYGTNKSND